MLDSLTHRLNALAGLTPDNRLLSSLLAVMLLALLYLLAFFVLRRLLPRLVSRSRTDWDDILLETGFFARLTHTVLAILLYQAVALLFGGAAFAPAVQGLMLVYVTLGGMLSLDALLSTAERIYQRFEIARQIPITGFVQVAKLLLYLLGGVLVVGLLLNRSPLVLLSGLGAMTAVLLLIFKDALLGLVAGVQLISNRMLAPGDWLEMPKYGADGDVLSISLTTVKVRNWDKTISTVPTYALISDSFKNWRGMQESGGRRIKRALYIDQRSIRFCTEEMLQRFRGIHYIAEYIDRKIAELEQHNRTLAVDLHDLVNLRRLTNIGTLRAYIVAYLRNHPRIAQHMTFLVRQLQPTAQGLPLEIYVFANTTAWAEYEAVQADIFDHLLAIVAEFDLSLFQAPSGNDVALALANVADR